MADINIGATFNDATRALTGGLWQTAEEEGGQGTGSVQRYVNDLTAVQQALTAQPGQFEGVSYVHARALLYQVDLERDYINGVANEPGGRGSNDNILDMIDIVQGDDNLAGLAHGGFANFPEPLNETPKYTDNAAQTSFWADFIARSNSLGQQAIADVTNHDAGASTALVKELQALKADVEAFD